MSELKQTATLAGRVQGVVVQMTAYKLSTATLSGNDAERVLNYISMLTSNQNN